MVRGSIAFEVKEPLLLIFVGGTIDHRSVYDAVRCSWKINVDRAKTYNLVLANNRGLIVGAFRPKTWLPGNPRNFPGIEDHDFADPLTGRPTRWGFVGDRAEPEVWNYYVGKQVPERYRLKGSQSPVRYCHPDDA